MSHNSIVVGLKHGKPRFIEIGHNDLPCWQDWSDLDVPTMELLVQKAFNQRFNAGWPSMTPWKSLGDNEAPPINPPLMSS